MLRSPRTASLGALACLWGVVLTGAATYLVPGARVRDSASLHGFALLDRPRLEPVLERIAHLADPNAYAVLAAGVVLVALARGRWRVAGLVAVVLLAAPATTELLKPLLASPRPTGWLGATQIEAASWPSGHSTAAMAVALCAVLAAPAALRPTAALAGGIFAVGVSFSLLALRWHFPSDVVGGYLVAATWTLLAVAVLRRWPQANRPRPTPVPRALTFGAPLAVALVAVAAAAAIAIDRPRGLGHYVAERPSFAIAAGAIALLAAVLAGALAFTTRG